MKTTKLGGTFAVILTVLSSTSANLAKAQTSDEVKRQQAALERQRVELENKSAEVEQKMRELEAAQQQLQAQQSAALKHESSGDVLFDYDKATSPPRKKP
jgi:prefoldin subunit 5